MDLLPALILRWLLFIPSCLLLLGTASAALPDLIDQVKPSIVAVGTYSKIRSPAFILRGTGFVIGNGALVASNAHVLPEILDSANGEMLVILARSDGEQLSMRQARAVAVDKPHDVAVLRFDGPPLPAMTISEAEVREGQGIAFTGFPIGGALGLTPVTHRGIIAAITPIALPSATAQQLNEQAIKRLKKGTFEVYQLDGTAYPGNSGGPLYDMEKGEVIGIVNMVFVKSTKELSLSQPSGITFAMPIMYLQELLKDLR